MIWFAAAAPPAGFLECNGQSTNPYPSLSNIVGPTVPDLRGKFIRGWDHGLGIDSGRTMLTIQIDTIQNITGTLGPFKPWASGMPDWNTGVFRVYGSPGGGSNDGDGAGWVSASFDASRVARTSTETRPINISLLPCIKY